MLSRYSSSPALRLSIADSAISRWLVWAYAGVCLLALLLLCSVGYAFIAAVLLMPLLAIVLPLLRSNEPHNAGIVLFWRAGQWALDKGAGPQPIELLPQSCVQPWVIYLSWRELRAGGRDSMWIFPGIGTGNELRALRVRLTLDHKSG